MKLRLESWFLYRYGSPQARRIQAVRDAHDGAFAHYQFEFGYGGPVHMVRSSENTTIEANSHWYDKMAEANGRPINYADIHSTHARLLFDPEASHLAVAFLDGIAAAEQVLA
ncbi:MAG: hypothetical protein KDE04_25740, partial [Anaerolineales bacterium]|nr:hypothetical protein [Anaerolineales bacterium]